MWWGGRRLADVFPDLFLQMISYGKELLVGRGQEGAMWMAS